MTSIDKSPQYLAQQGKQSTKKPFTKLTKVDVVATSSVIPKVELQRGLQILLRLGFDCKLATNLLAADFAYAGSVDERASAFYQAALTDSQIVWAVRGGYGAAQLLESLSQLTAEHGVPAKKLLIGYSDITALYQFVSEHWGWDILHASMVSSQDLQSLYQEDQLALLSFIDRRSGKARWDGQPLNWISQVKMHSDTVIKGQLYGGNLAVICSLIGTPWQLDFSNKILFIEEIGESWSKIDRLLQQLHLSSSLKTCKGIILGHFSHCLDASPKGLAAEDKDLLVELRPVLTPEQALYQVFSRFSALTCLAVCAGLPIGHIKHNAPLPLLAHYELSISKGLVFSHWQSREEGSN